MADDGWSLGDLVPNELKNFYESPPARVLDKYRAPDTKRLDPNAVDMGMLDRAGIKYDGNDPYAQEAKSEAENALRFGGINRDIIKQSMQPEPLSWQKFIGGAIQKAGGVVSFAQHTPGAAENFNNTELDRYLKDQPEQAKELREAMLKSTLDSTHGAQDAWMKFSQARLQKRMDARKQASIIAARNDDPVAGKKEGANFLRMQGYDDDAKNFEAAPQPRDVAATPPMPEAATVAPPQGGPPATPAAAPPSAPPGPAASVPAAPAGVPPQASGIPAPPPGEMPGPTLAALGRMPTGAISPPPVPQPAAQADAEPKPAPPPQLPPSAYAPPNQNEVEQLIAKQKRLMAQGDPDGAKQAKEEADMRSKRYKLEAINKDGDRGWVDTWGRENPKPYLPDAGNQERRDAETAGGDAYYEYLKKAKGATYAARAKAIADFNQDPLGTRASGSMMGDVQLLNPSYKVADYGVYKKAMQDYAPGGKIGVNMVAARTALDHVGNLLEVIPKLHNSSMLPSISNRAHSFRDYEFDRSTKGDRYQDAYADFKTLGGGVSTELDKAFKGGVPDVAGMADIKQNLDNPYAPPNALIHSAGTAVHMLGQRLYEMKQAHDQATFGKDPNWSPLSPHAQKVYDEVAAKLGIDTPWKAPPESEISDDAIDHLREDIKKRGAAARADFNEAFGRDADKRALEEGEWASEFDGTKLKSKKK